MAKKIFNIFSIILIGSAVFLVPLEKIGAALDITTTSLPPGTQNQKYLEPGFQFEATGATNYTWAWSKLETGYRDCGDVTRTLPPGLSLSVNGLLFGTPTQSGNFGFRITVNNDTMKRFCMIISPPEGATPTSLQMVAPFPPNGQPGKSYSHYQKAAGGTEPYTWSLLKADQGEWLYIDTKNNEGLLFGTPPSDETVAFTLRVTDSKGKVGEGKFSIVIGTGVKPSDSGSTGSAGSQTRSAPTGLQIAWPPSPLGTVLQEDSLTILIKYFYEWGISLGGLAVFVILVIAGFQYLTSAGNAAKMSDAMGRIRSASFGLILLLGSVLLLNTINPQLTQLRIPQLDPQTQGATSTFGIIPTSDPGGEECESVVLYSSPDFENPKYTLGKGAKDNFPSPGVTVKSIKIKGDCLLILYPRFNQQQTETQVPSIFATSYSEVSGDASFLSYQVIDLK